jgi:hypothetical protein
MSSLPDGWQLAHAGPESNGLFTFRESALMPPRHPDTFEGAAKVNWRSVLRSMMHLLFAPAVMFGPDDAFLTTILKLLR